MMRRTLSCVPFAALAIALAGCGAPASQKQYPTASMPAQIRDIKKGLASNVDAGQPLPASVDTKRWNDLAKTKVFASRPDPFALSPDEQKFDKSQFAAKLFDTQRFNPEFDQIPDATKPDIVPEEQPYRRLAGIIVGDSILAIIEMGNGQPAQVVRPGEQIAGSEWRVISIDSEKAVLRREGDKLPHEVVVHLEGKPVSMDAPPATANPQPAPGLGQPGAGGARGGGRAGARGGGG